MSGKGKSLFISFFLFVFFSFSQEITTFEFIGKAYKNLKPMAGVKLQLYKSNVKVFEMVTGKDGKFELELDLGFDYKVMFSAPGHIDQYLVVYTSKVKDSKYFLGYQAEVHMFEQSQPNINAANFKNPYTKVVLGTNPKNGKPVLMDEQPYLDNFLKNIYVDLEKIKRDEEAKLAAEKLKKEQDEAERIRREAEEKARQEQLLAAQKKAYEEAELLRKLQEERKRSEEEKIRNLNKNNIALKEDKTNDDNLDENLKLTLEKEQKKIKERQNKGVKIAYENDLIKMVAENERQLREKEFKKQKNVAYTNEVIETLKEEATLKAKADEVRFNQKQKAKLATLNGQIKNKEMTNLVKDAASAERENKAGQVKTYPTIASYKPAGPVGVTTNLETTKFKVVYSVTVYTDEKTTVYRKESYSFGMTYYYKDNLEIKKEQYQTELSQYKVPL